MVIQKSIQIVMLFRMKTKQRVSAKFKKTRSQFKKSVDYSNKRGGITEAGLFLHFTLFAKHLHK